MKLVFASNNAHKLSEVRAIMPTGIDILSLHDIGFEAEIEETGATLEENSALKAEAVAQWLKGQMADMDGVFADDTGLEIEALSGRPGVHTARWYLEDGGEVLSGQANFAANRTKALRELAGKENRNAQFRTVITLIKQDGDRVVVSGIVRGQIATEEYGQGGFGYDPIFIPEGYDKTFGELPTELKNGISHRARALEALVKELK